MISYAHYLNSNHTFEPSSSSVIVRNDFPCKNSIPVPEVYIDNRSSAISTIPTAKVGCIESKKAKLMHQSTSSSANTGRLKTSSYTSSESSQSLSNQYARHVLNQPYRQSSNQIDTVSYSTVMAQRDLDTPPPAHLNAMVTSVLPKFAPKIVPVNYCQTEPLDLVVVGNSQKPNSDHIKTNVPSQFDSGNNDVKPDLQVNVDNCDINLRFINEKNSSVELSLPDNIQSLSPLIVTTSPTTNLTIVPATFSSSSSSITPCILPAASTNSMQISSTITTIIPITLTKTTSLTISPTPSTTTSTIIPTSTLKTIIPSTAISTVISKTTSTTVSVKNSTSSDSSPSTPPPILMPAPYTEMSCGIKTHHHKLKKAWLQRHVWAEDLKEAGANIDQNQSSSLAHIDETPPVLKCENFQKKKRAKIKHENNVKLKSTSEVSSCDSDMEPRSLIDGTKKSRKRKFSNMNAPLTSKSATGSVKNSDLKVEKKTLPVKIPKKRGRKPKIVVSIGLPLKKMKNKKGVVFFQSGPCLNGGPEIQKCRECRLFINRKKKTPITQDEIDNIFCRFYTFRRLFTNESGLLVNAGFPDPYKDITVVRFTVKYNIKKTFI